MSDNGSRSANGHGSSVPELTCEEALARVYEYLDGELDASQHEGVRLHLQKCRKCYPYFDFERLFLDYIHELGAADQSRPGLENRIRSVLAAQAD